MKNPRIYFENLSSEKMQYLIRDLPFHLYMAGKKEFLHTLLCNFDFLETKTELSGIRNLINDYSLVDSYGLKIIDETLHQIEHIIGLDKSQLWAQLYARLSWLEIDEVTSLLKTEPSYHWFRLNRPSLSNPTGALLNVLIGHTAPIDDLKIFNNNYAISSSYGGELRIWNLLSGENVFLISIPGTRPPGIAVSNKGKLLITYYHTNYVDLWDLNRGESISKEVFSDDTVVSSILFSENTYDIFIGITNGDIKVWNLKSHSEVRLFQGHKEEITQLCLDEKNNILISASLDNTINIWDLNSGTVLYSLLGHIDRINGLLLTPDGLNIISASSDKTIKIWDLNKGKLIYTVDGYDKVYSISVTSDGKRLISASHDHTIRLWDLATRREIKSITAHDTVVNVVHFLPNSNYVVSASNDNTLKLWDMDKDVNYSKIGHECSINDMVIDHLTNCIFTCSGAFGNDDYSIKLWDIKTLKKLRDFVGHTHWVTHVCIIPGQTRFLSGSIDKTIRLWDRNSGELLKTFTGHKDEIRSLIIAPDGSYAISGSYDSLLMKWNLINLSLVYSCMIKGDGIDVIEMTPDGKLAIIGSRKGTITVLDLIEGQINWTSNRHKDWVEAIAVSSDSSFFLSASSRLSER